MKRDLVSKVMAEMGRKGGKRRLKTLTPEQRRESAQKAAAKRWEGHNAKRPASARKKPSK
jgi:hypothetical protein